MNPVANHVLVVGIAKTTLGIFFGKTWTHRISEGQAAGLGNPSLSRLDSPLRTMIAKSKSRLYEEPRPHTTWGLNPKKRERRRFGKWDPGYFGWKKSFTTSNIEPCTLMGKKLPTSTGLVKYYSR